MSLLPSFRVVTFSMRKKKKIRDIVSVLKSEWWVAIPPDGKGHTKEDILLHMCTYSTVHFSFIFEFKYV